ncbi:hypothetical protein J3R83DRAFT_10198 [Lanmaoa asiatica]|nr:hypothetical protein J3R83DRAFT_10198 [Lanmaoa asiatica]
MDIDEGSGSGGRIEDDNCGTNGVQGMLISDDEGWMDMNKEKSYYDGIGQQWVRKDLEPKWEQLREEVKMMNELQEELKLLKSKNEELSGRIEKGRR